MASSIVRKLCTSYLCALCILLINVGSAHSRVYLDITSPDTRKINIGIPWFTNSALATSKQPLGRRLSQTLGRALRFHGIIDIVDAGNLTLHNRKDWKRVGADYAVLGQYSISGEQLTLEMRLYDVAGDEVILGKSFSGTMKQKDRMLFKFCDNVIKTMTGSPGIADSRIAFIGQSGRIKEVYLTDILGNKLRQVTRHKHLTVSPRFVPKSSFLTYSSYHTGNQNLYITDLRQSKTTRVLSHRKGLNLAPAWSPDGKYMVLTLSKYGSPDLFLMDNKGKIIEQLTSRAGINVSATWSPDSRYLVFVSDRSGSPQIYRMDMQTRKVIRLSFEGSENAEPSWSPTENLIVFSSLRNGVYQLYTMNPLKTDYPSPLTTDLSHHESPSWSPDGNQVIFAKRDGKRTQIYAIMKDGNYQRRLFSFPGSQTSPQWSR